MTSLKRLGLFAVPALLATAWLQSEALASPQVLVLLETDGPVKFQCEAGSCVAELPSMCLQPDRRAPQAGRTYRALAGADLRLVGKTGDGSDLSLPLPADARISALRTHVAVTLSVPRAWVDANFAALDGIHIASVSPLAPQPAPDDAHPMTSAEIEIASTRLIETARTVLADAPGRVAAARIAGRMINALPPSGRVDDATLEAVWRDEGEGSMGSEADGADASLARLNYDYCRYSAANGLYTSVRDCLQAQQDGAIEGLYIRYVETLSEADAGS